MRFKCYPRYEIDTTDISDARCRILKLPAKRSLLLMRSYPLLIVLSLLATNAWSQTSPASYDPRLTFAPLTLPDPVNAYRSGNGAPGPSYWQNEADYEMHASLDTAAKGIHNDEVITYTNNSHDTLTSLWIHMEQNTY